MWSALVFSKFKELCSHHHYLILEHFTQKSNHVSISSYSPFPPPSSPWQLLIYFLSLCLFLFLTFPVNGIIYYMAFCVCNAIRFENVELLVIFPRGPPTFFADLVLKMPVLHARDSYRCWEVKIPCTVS